MAYAVKYLFKFASANGTTREIRVLKDGYEGDPIQRPLGQAPVLKKQQNGPICGTSLEIQAECHVDQEFVEFYTSDPKEYRVDLYAGATLLWQGYITPELYSEPDIAPPYDVRVVATDGIGELKLYDFAASGVLSLRSMLAHLLGPTGLGTDVFLISSLKPGSHGAGALLDMTVNLDYMVGKTYYDVLAYLLDTLHASITWWKGAWILTRETNVTFTNNKVRYFNTAGNSALLADSVQALGQMYQDPAWPSGQLSTVIDPSKNKVVVQAPWHPVTALANPDMEQDSDWGTHASYDSTLGAYWIPWNALPLYYIWQAVSVGGIRLPLSLRVGCSGSATGHQSWMANYGSVSLRVVYEVTGGSSYQLTIDGDGNKVWVLESEATTNVTCKQDLNAVDVDRANAETVELEIPPFLLDGAFPAGSLIVNISGYCVFIFSAHLDLVISKGYADILHIDNGARGEGDTTEIAFGKATSDTEYYKGFLQGLLLDDGAVLTIFADANFTSALDYLAFISRDYALSVALPRARVEGTVFLESSIQIPPLVFTKDGLNYWLETWSWNLYEDELQISARTLPAASLTVESEVITESDASAVSPSSSSSSGGGSVAPVGTNYFELDGEHAGGVRLKEDYDTLLVADLFFGDDAQSLDAITDIISASLASLQAQVDAVATRDMFDELTASAAFIDTVAADTIFTDTAHANRYYLTDSIYFYTEDVSGTTCVRLNAPFITEGDQIIISGTPGGGGGGSASYLYELLDMSSAIAGKPTAAKLLVFNPSGTDKNGNTGAWEYADTIAISHVAGLQTALDGKQATISDLATIRSNASHGQTAYGWGDHSAAGYLLATTAASTYQPIVSDLATIRSNASHGQTAYGWGNHANAGYLLASTAAATYQPIISDLATIRSNASNGNTAYGWGDTLSVALQSLQAQVDAVATRDMFDELTATAVFADTIAASSGYFDTIAGNLEGNATTASYLSSSTYSKGSGTNPVYFSGGLPVASTSTVGSAAVPVFLSGGTITQCTAASLFSALSSSAATNLSATIAGQTRSATLYATYDSASENISDKFTIVGNALASLQAQIDSVATKCLRDEVEAVAGAFDMLSARQSLNVGGINLYADGNKLYIGDTGHYVEIRGTASAPILYFNVTIQTSGDQII